jgi:hypothetical protein
MRTHRRSTFSQTPSNQAPCAPPARLGAALLYATPTRSPSLNGCRADSNTRIKISSGKLVETEVVYT